MEWAFAITERLKNTDHYIQHSSHLAEIEINMHGNPLVILTAYMPHDASAEIKRLAAWEEMSNRIRNVTQQKRSGTRRPQCSFTCEKRRGGRMPGTSSVGKAISITTRKRRTTTRKYEQKHPYRTTKGT